MNCEEPLFVLAIRAAQRVCLAPFGRSAGFQTCRIADFQSAEPSPVPRLWRRRSVCGLETRDTAGLETCIALQRGRHAKHIRERRLGRPKTPAPLTGLHSGDTNK